MAKNYDEIGLANIYRRPNPYSTPAQILSQRRELARGQQDFLGWFREGLGAFYAAKAGKWEGERAKEAEEYGKGLSAKNAAKEELEAERNAFADTSAQLNEFNKQHAAKLESEYLQAYNDSKSLGATDEEAANDAGRAVVLEANYLKARGKYPDLKEFTGMNLFGGKQAIDGITKSGDRVKYVVADGTTLVKIGGHWVPSDGVTDYNQYLKGQVAQAQIDRANRPVASRPSKVTSVMVYDGNGQAIGAFPNTSEGLASAYNAGGRSIRSEKKSLGVNGTTVTQTEDIPLAPPFVPPQAGGVAPAAQTGRRGETMGWPDDWRKRATSMDPSAVQVAQQVVNALYKNRGQNVANAFGDYFFSQNNLGQKAIVKYLTGDMSDEGKAELEKIVQARHPELYNLIK